MKSSLFLNPSEPASSRAVFIANDRALTQLRSFCALQEPDLRKCINDAMQLGMGERLASEHRFRMAPFL